MDRGCSCALRVRQAGQEGEELHRRNRDQGLGSRDSTAALGGLRNRPTRFGATAKKAHPTSIPWSISTPEIKGATICETDCRDCVSPRTLPCSEAPAVLVMRLVSAGRS